MTCRFCKGRRHRIAGRFVRSDESNCAYFNTVWYRMAVQTFYSELESMMNAIRFFRDDVGAQVNENVGPRFGGMGCIA